MSKLLTAAAATLAVLLAGCGAVPTSSAASALRTASISRSVPVDTQIARALAPTYPGQLIFVTNVNEESRTPGTFDFQAVIQTHAHRAVTTLHGQFATVSHQLQVLDNTTDDATNM